MTAERTAALLFTEPTARPWAGRTDSITKLPQNHLEDLADARALVKSGDFDAVKMLYEDVPDTLSQLIRTAFIPKDGCQFYVSTSVPSRQESSPGMRVRPGGRRSLKMAATFTAPVPVRCSVFLS